MREMFVTVMSVTAMSVTMCMMRCAASRTSLLTHMFDSRTINIIKFQLKILLSSLFQKLNHRIQRIYAENGS